MTAPTESGEAPTISTHHRRASDEPPRIAVVIPAYRVAPYIAQVVGEIPALVSEILVVDDKSPDDIAAALAEVRDPRVTLVRHEVNQGVGGAVQTGYRHAEEKGCEIFVKVDGDGQMDLSYFSDLIEPLLSGRADYAKGNRFLHSAELRSMPLIRRLGNLSLTFLGKCASGYWHLFDPANGYTAMHVDAWRRLDRHRLANRYFFESSLLIELGCRRAVVEDVAIPARYQGEVSSLNKTRAFFEFPPRLFAGFLRRIRTWYFLYDVTPVSLFLTVGLFSVLFAVTWGGYHWRRSFETGVASPTGTVMIAVVSLVLGFQLLLQALALDMQNVPREPIQRRGRSR